MSRELFFLDRVWLGALAVVVFVATITTEDPVVLTRPWTGRFPLKLDPKYEWWEYACHEGNRTIRDYINASRAKAP